MSCYSFFLMIFQKGHDFYEGVRAGKHAHQKRFSNIIIQKFTIVVLLWRSLQVHTATAERKLPRFPQVLLIGLLCGQNLLFQSTRAMLFPLCNLSSLTLFIHHFTFNTDSTEQLHVSLVSRFSVATELVEPATQCFKAQNQEQLFAQKTVRTKTCFPPCPEYV